MQIRLHVVTMCNQKKSACGQCKKLHTWCRPVRVIPHEIFSCRTFWLQSTFPCFRCAVLSVQILSPCRRKNSDSSYLLILCCFMNTQTHRRTSRVRCLSFQTALARCFSPCSRGRFVLRMVLVARTVSSVLLFFVSRCFYLWLSLCCVHGRRMQVNIIPDVFAYASPPPPPRFNLKN